LATSSPETDVLALRLDDLNENSLNLYGVPVSTTFSFSLSFWPERFLDCTEDFDVTVAVAGAVVGSKIEATLDSFLDS
jgi:hypothetical protein